MHLTTGTLQVADNVCHTRLVAHHGSQVNGLLGIILGESLDFSTVSGSTLAGQECQRTMAGVLELEGECQKTFYKNIQPD